MIIEFVRAGNVSLNDSSRIMYVVAANSSDSLLGRETDVMSLFFL